MIGRATGTGPITTRGSLSRSHKPGTLINDIAAHEDMLPTLLAEAGDTTVKEGLLKGKQVGDTTFKVHSAPITVVANDSVW